MLSKQELNQIRAEAERLYPDVGIMGTYLMQRKAYIAAATKYQERIKELELEVKRLKEIIKVHP